MEYKLNKKVRIGDKIIGFFFPSIRTKGYCGNCGRNVFNDKAHFAKKGLCVYCNNVSSHNVGNQEKDK